MLFNFFWSSFSLWLIQFFDASTWWKCYSNNNGRSWRCTRDGYSSIKYFLIIEWFIDSKWRRVHELFCFAPELLQLLPQFIFTRQIQFILLCKNCPIIFRQCKFNYCFIFFFTKNNSNCRIFFGQF